MRSRRHANDNAGFWDRPHLMNLSADFLLFAAIAALAYAAILGLGRLPLFPLREVVVTHALREVSALQVEHAARRAVVGNFLTVNLDAVRAAFEQLPWVRRADVRRRWPNGIELALEEHVASARWKPAAPAQARSSGEGAEPRLVSRNGEVFAASSDANLPLFAGPEGSAPLILARYREMVRILAPLDQRPVEVVLSPRHAWQLRLDGGLVLDIGRDHAKAPVNERLARFAGVHREAMERLQARAEVIDLRYPNGFAVRPARAGTTSGH